MRISLSITNFSWSPSSADIADRLVGVARAADEGGLDTIWVADHLLQADPNSSPDAAMLEAYTTLAFLAAHTRRVRLGTMVTGVTFRPPALLIKAVTTLDVLSGGRAWLGSAPATRRMRRARWVCRCLRRPNATSVWRRRFASPSRCGRATVAVPRQVLRLEHPISSPQPLSQPRPPILIGGMGERKTLRLVAQYADACNLFDIPDEGATIRRKLAVLARHCEDLGRDYGSVEKTLSSRLESGESAEQFAARCARLAALGIDHVVLITTGPWSREAVDVLCAARLMVDASTA